MTPTDSPSPSWWVICLCAEWCGVCREWRDAFTQAAAAHPGMHFAWVDVEDEAQAMGEVDIETFPTLLIAREDEALFLGSLQPSAAQVGRLIASLRDNPAPAPGMPAEATALLHRLTASVLPKV
jgi:thioredoxin 1